MYTLKQQPQDFIVEEIYDYELDSGTYALYLLEKTSLSTFQAIDIIAKVGNIPKRNIAYAGVKDKHATTKQYITIKFGTKQIDIEHENIKLTYLGQVSKAMHLGAHQENKFTITVRKMDQPLQEIHSIPNYFGEQRFAKHNHKIGKAIIQKDFKQALDLLLENDGYQEQRIREFLEKQPNNYIAALRLLDPKLLSLIIESYQSYLFNQMLADYISNNVQETFIHKETFGDLLFPKQKINNIQLPLIGFHSQETQQVKEMLEKENITTRDFIIKSLPHASSPGGQRDAIVQLKDLQTLDFKDKQQTVSFTLPKGSYATIAIRAMISI